MDTMLLATFTKASQVEYTKDLVNENFEVVNGKIFILKDVENPFKRILTYNVVKKDITFSEVVKNTISLHRKKETNTLYTLNALNEVVILQNEGTLDSSFAVDWEEYANCILLIQKDEHGEEELKRIDTALIKVVDLNKEN
jgi:hypothetical protein